LTPEVITIFILDALFVFFATVAFIISLKISLFYDAKATSIEQYTLEKQSYLGATIIKYIFYIKIPLFVFCIFTLDKISIILPGAMCGAGVVNATEYGTYLLVLKVLNIYLFAYWLTLHTEDMQDERQPYMKLKFQLFTLFYILLIGEIILESLMFLSIDIKDVVDCCGVIFSNSESTYMASILNTSPIILLSLFYGSFIIMIVVYLSKLRYLFSLLNIIFLLFSLITLISFFGTYIYEMPTHHCPFCFLQKEYNYVGYLIYVILFFGTFHGLLVGLINFKVKKLQKYYNIALFLNTMYLIIVSSYPILYFIKNSVLL
jgi:hypothetical protein